MRVVELTGEECEVQGFSSELGSTKNIPIVAAITAWTNPNTGETIILRFNQILWYGDRLPVSLINPNQLRHQGVPVCDDITDGDRYFGIELEDDYKVPFNMSGTRVSFETRVPTADEERECRHFTMTCDESWDPATVVIGRVQTLQGKERTELRSLISGVTRGEVLSSNPNYLEQPLSAISDTLDDRIFTERVISKVNIVSAMQSISMDDDSDGDTFHFGPPRPINAVFSETRHSTITPEELSRKFRCGLETAKKTLKRTTQRGVRTAIHPLHRRYRERNTHLHLNRLNCSMSTDTLFASTKSLQGNTCGQIYTAEGFTKVYPMIDHKADSVGDTLKDVMRTVGVPKEMICDLAPEMVGPNTTFRKKLTELGVAMRNSEKGRSKQNPAEGRIGEVKKKWKDLMIRKKVPKRLWDYALVWIGEILSRTASGHDGIPGLEKLLGQTIDISEWLDFDFYDLIWYWDESKRDMTTDNCRLGRWLGVSHSVGADLSYWILTDSGQIISRSTVQHVTRDDTAKPEIKNRIDDFNEKVTRRLDDANFRLDPGVNFIVDDLNELPAYDEEPDDDDDDNDDDNGRPDIDDYGAEYYDKFIGAEVKLQRGPDQIKGRVKKRARDDETGELIGRLDPNPMVSTAEYEVEFPDGETERYEANIIAENIFAQCDDEGNQYLIIDEISDHRRDETAIPKENGFVLNDRNGRRYPKKTTRGWSHLVTFKDGTTQWIPLKDLKDTYAIEVAEYAVANKIHEEPAYAWWAPHVLKKRNRIIGKLKKRYWRTTHKFGVEVPHSVDRALQLDAENGNTLWYDALKKEMDKIMIAFSFRDDMTPEDVRADPQLLVGYQEISCHTVFDVKMDFTRKARFCANGSKTDTPTQTYSSVVSRDSVRIAFLLAGLNGLDIKACDIGNAYLNATNREKIWFKAGKEFRENAGKVVIIERALYGLKSSGAAWRSMLKKFLTGKDNGMGFTPTKGDPDVYIRPAVGKDGFEYYEMIFVYVDDLLILSEDTDAILKLIDGTFKLKEGSAGPPKIYLGANIEPYELPDGTIVWSMTAKDYVKESVKNLKMMLNKDGRTLPGGRWESPLPANYRPELDVTPELDPDLASRYQQLIGVLRWMCEIGRIDILHEVSLMSQYLALPRTDHLERLYGIFAYLNKHENCRVVFDDNDPVYLDGTFTERDWSDVYDEDEMKEEIPANLPEPRGVRVFISCFVDANHAGNVVTRKSHSGILIFIQNAPIIWYSKRQNTVEASTFGSEFVALRIAKEQIEALRYKLRSFGVPIDGPARVFCDNDGVVKNASIPDSALSKKHNAINYNAVREACARGTIIVGKEDGTTNLADFLTKIITGLRRCALLKNVCPW